MREINPSGVGVIISERRMKDLRIEFAMQMKYMILDSLDVATDIWAVGTIFSIKEVTMFVALCYVVSLVTGLVYTAFMYTRRVKYIFEIRREMTGANQVRAFESSLKELNRKYLGEVLMLLSGLLEDVPSIMLNLYIWYLGFEETAFTLSLFFSLICAGVKSSALEKMSIYRRRINHLKKVHIVELRKTLRKN